MKQYVFHDGVFTFHTACYGSWNNDRQIVFRVRIDTTPTKHASDKRIVHFDCLVPSTSEDISLWLSNNPEYPLGPIGDQLDGTVILFEDDNILVYRKTGSTIFVKNKKIEGCCIRVSPYFGGLQVVAPESHLSPYSVHGLPAFQVQGGRNS